MPTRLQLITKEIKFHVQHVAANIKLAMATMVRPVTCRPLYAHAHTLARCVGALITAHGIRLDARVHQMDPQNPGRWSSCCAALKISHVLWPCFIFHSRLICSASQTNNFFPLWALIVWQRASSYPLRSHRWFDMWHTNFTVNFLPV